MKIITNKEEKKMDYEKLNKGKSFWGGIIFALGGALTAAAIVLPEANVAKIWAMFFGILLDTFGGALLGVGIAHKVQKGFAQQLTSEADKMALAGSAKGPTTRKMNSNRGFISLSALLLVFALVIGFTLAGCAVKNSETGEWELGYEATCTIYQEYGATPENSLIAKYISDPCIARRMIRVSAKAPAIKWKKAYTTKYWQVSGIMRAEIKAGRPLSFLQDMFILSFAKYNEDISMAALIASDEILTFSTVDSIMKMDQAMLLGLLDKMDADIQRIDRYLDLFGETKGS